MRFILKIKSKKLLLIANLLSKQISIWKVTIISRILLKIFRILKKSMMKIIAHSKLKYQKNSLDRMKKICFLTTLFQKRLQKMNLAENLAITIKICYTMIKSPILAQIILKFRFNSMIILILFLRRILNMVLKFMIKTYSHKKMLIK